MLSELLSQWEPMKQPEQWYGVGAASALADDSGKNVAIDLGIRYIIRTQLLWNTNRKSYKISNLSNILLPVTLSNF